MQFRLQVLEEITREPDNETKLALIRLLDEEGNRDRATAEVGIRTGGEVEVRAYEFQMAQNETESGIQLEQIKADTAADLRKDLALRHVSWRFAVATVSPVIFAVLVVVFMFLFWKWKQPDATGAFEKVLLMLITGGLGWAAGRGRAQDSGTGRLEDRLIFPKKTKEDSA